MGKLTYEHPKPVLHPEIAIGEGLSYPINRIVMWDAVPSFALNSVVPKWLAVQNRPRSATKRLPVPNHGVEAPNYMTSSKRERPRTATGRRSVPSYGIQPPDFMTQKSGTRS